MEQVFFIEKKKQYFVLVINNRSNKNKAINIFSKYELACKY